MWRVIWVESTEAVIFTGTNKYNDVMLSVTPCVFLGMFSSPFQIKPIKYESLVGTVKTVTLIWTYEHIWEMHALHRASGRVNIALPTENMLVWQYCVGEWLVRTSLLYAAYQHRAVTVLWWHTLQLGGTILNACLILDLKVQFFHLKKCFTGSYVKCYVYRCKMEC